MVLSKSPTNQIARITFGLFVLPVTVRSYRKDSPAVASLTTLVEGYAPHLRVRIKLFKIVLEKGSYRSTSYLR